MFQKNKYKTVLGGLLTLICLIICVIIMILLGEDFLYKKNPTVSSANLDHSQYQKIYPTQQNIILPFRIQDDLGEIVDFENKIYPVAYYYYFDGKENPNDDIVPDRYLLNISKCSNDIKKRFNKMYNITLDLEKYYCIEMDNLFLGGSWNGDFLYFIEFDLYICPNGINWNNNLTGCANLDFLNQYLGSSNPWYFSMYYPVVGFDPVSSKYPLKISYSSYLYALNFMSKKIDRMYIRENIIRDDQGVIVNQEFNTSAWGVNELKSDFYFTSGDYYNNNVEDEAISSRIYCLNIYLSTDILFHTRSYLKLTTCLANIAIFWRGLFFICSIISNIYHINKRNSYFLNTLFDYNIQRIPITRLTSIKRNLDKYGQNEIINNSIKDNSQLSLFANNNNKLKIKNKISKHSSFLNVLNLQSLQKSILKDHNKLFDNNNNDKDLNRKSNNIENENVSGIYNNKIQIYPQIDNSLKISESEFGVNNIKISNSAHNNHINDPNKQLRPIFLNIPPIYFGGSENNDIKKNDFNSQKTYLKNELNCHKSKKIFTYSDLFKLNLIIPYFSKCNKYKKLSKIFNKYHINYSILENGNNYFKNQIDLTTYIKFFNEFTNIKKFTLTKEQFYSFEFLKNINLASKEEIHKMNISQEEMKKIVYNYYKKENLKKIMKSRKDMWIYENLY